MKSIVTLAIVAFLGMTTVQAQKVANAPVQKEQVSQIDMLAQKLILTAEQKANVAKTLTGFKATEDRLKASNMNATDKQAALDKVASRKNGNLKTYLTDEQYAMYVKLTQL